MKVRLIAPRNVTEFAEKHAGSMPLFKKFLEDIDESEWDRPNDIKTTFSSADLIGDSRVIFDVGGNTYRVICKYVVKSTEFVLYLKWIGKHDAYTKLCKKGGNSLLIIIDMENTGLKYTVIKNMEQYRQYCRAHEALNSIPEEKHDKGILAELELLDLLLETYDREKFILPERDPVESLKSHMENNGYTAKALGEELGIHKTVLSEILNYHRRMSKEVIRKISERFKVRQEIFNRPYELKVRAGFVPLKSYYKTEVEVQPLFINKEGKEIEVYVSQNDIATERRKAVRPRVLSRSLTARRKR